MIDRRFAAAVERQNQDVIGGGKRVTKCLPMMRHERIAEGMIKRDEAFGARFEPRDIVRNACGMGSIIGDKQPIVDLHDFASIFQALISREYGCRFFERKIDIEGKTNGGGGGKILSIGSPAKRRQNADNLSATGAQRKSTFAVTIRRIDMEATVGNGRLFSGATV